MGLPKFLLVRNSNLSPILHHFRVTAFMCSWPTSSLFYGNFGMFPSRCTRSPMLGSASAQALSYSAVKLFSKDSNLCEHDTGTWNSQTDRQTDRRYTVAIPRALYSIARENHYIMNSNSWYVLYVGFPYAGGIYL